jgi:hypothetical protein
MSYNSRRVALPARRGMRHAPRMELTIGSVIYMMIEMSLDRRAAQADLRVEELDMSRSAALIALGIVPQVQGTTAG